MSDVAPPPYPEVPNANTQGSPQYSGDQPNISPPYGGNGPIIIVQEPKQHQHQPVMGHQRGGGGNHVTCCLLCFLTGGLTLPCWICCCLLDDR
jgi:hypothetical protein